MMAEYHRLPDQKYTEAEYLFQTIEMAKSDEEYDVELCSTPPPSAEIVDLELVSQEPAAATIFSWKVSKRRQRPHRRYTVSHGAPPAPPSTPTSLTTSSTPAPSPTASSNIHVNVSADDEPLNSLLYILDYAPKYKKKLKEQQRTDAELAELFNVVTITSSGTSGANGSGGGTGSSSSSGSGGIANGSDARASKLPPERGVSAASRVIRKHDASTKIFKIHRNPKEFFREPVGGEEEDSVSAPEYDDAEEEQTRFRRLARLKPSFTRHRLLQTKRERRFARFEHQERMDAMVDNFDAAMRFNDA